MFLLRSRKSKRRGYDHKERIVPTDVLINILVRLPATSLLKLKPVSKEWFQIISNHGFVEAHIAYQSSLPLGSAIIFSSTQEVLFIGGTSSSNPNPPRFLNLPGSHRGYTTIHGSCKGLILYESNTKSSYIKLLVANPLTGDSVALPPFHASHTLKSASIGCASGGGEFKVVLVANQFHNQTPFIPLQFYVLTLGSNKWRYMHAPFPLNLFLPYIPPTFAGGAFHWRYDKGVLSLDLGQEKFCQTDFTFTAKFLPRARLFCEWDGCLAFVESRSKRSKQLYEVWVLRESGWTKQNPSMDSAFFKLLRPWENFSDYGLDCPYFSATMGNGQILLLWKTCKDNIQLLAYDIGRRVLTDFSQFDRSYFMHYKEECWSNNTHVNSLVSCSPTLKRIRVSREGKIIFPSVFDALSKHLTCFVRTIKFRLFK